MWQREQIPLFCSLTERGGLFRQGRFFRYPSQAKPVSISSEPLLTPFSPFNPIGIEKPLERRKIDSRALKAILGLPSAFAYQELLLVLLVRFLITQYLLEIRNILDCFPAVPHKIFIGYVNVTCTTFVDIQKSVIFQVFNRPCNSCLPNA